MAEGDTIHRAARSMRPILEGREVAHASAPSPRSTLGPRAGSLRGRAIERVEARGKNLLVHFQDRLVLHSHLGMNGSWRVFPRGGRRERSTRSAWLVLGTEAGDAALYRPSLARLLTPAQAASDPRLARLGPDLLDESFRPGDGVVSLRRSAGERTLGEALLDQRCLAGVGNIFKSEGCFEAAVSPWRALEKLSDDELERVVAQTAALMRRAVEAGRPPRRVYRRSGQPCPRCGERVRSRGQGDANRTTYWCRGCQS